jgi:hypothetical protein
MHRDQDYFQQRSKTEVVVVPEAKVVASRRCEAAESCRVNGGPDKTGEDSAVFNGYFR